MSLPRLAHPLDHIAGAVDASGSSILTRKTIVSAPRRALPSLRGQTAHRPPPPPQGRILLDLVSRERGRRPSAGRLRPSPRVFSVRWEKRAASGLEGMSAAVATREDRRLHTRAVIAGRKAILRGHALCSLDSVQEFWTLARRLGLAGVIAGWKAILRGYALCSLASVQESWTLARRLGLAGVIAGRKAILRGYALSAPSTVSKNLGRWRDGSV